MEALTPYPHYKPSGISWIGHIPKHWEVKRLKYVANAQPSNVDKKVNEEELPVQLCNYVDVYKNDYITGGLSFMKATANENEIQKFKLRIGDVIITKDSETPEEIAIPAFVKHEADDLICGYHLTQIRADKINLYGEYLFRLFQTKMFNANFEAAATGVTRFALSSDEINDVHILLPPLPEQTAIAQYLDEKSALLDKLIANKQQLITLLKEERTALINEAVTKGIKSAAKYVASSVEWLGLIPFDWKVKRLRFLCKITTGAKNTEDRVEDGTYPFFVRSQTIERINSYSYEGEGILTAGDGVGVAKVFHYINGKFDFHQRVYLFYEFTEEIDAHFLFFFLQINLEKEVLRYNAKSTVDSLRLPMLKDFPITFPKDKSEQQRIVAHIQTHTQRIDGAIAKIEKEIELLQEYKTALISEVVTGKVKVV